MKVLVICSASFRSGQTGDATQGRMTVSALRKLGCDVTVALVSYFPLRFEKENGVAMPFSDVVEFADQCDVVHLLPVNPVLARLFSKNINKPILGSSIFWGGWERVIIAWRSASKLKSKIHDALREMKPLLKYRMNYRGVDVFLPNSTAEGKCVFRCFKKSKNASYFPVPNGFVPPAREKINSLPRSSKVPIGDYVVVPGVFARRKNQLSLIKALKGTSIPIVFLGGAHSAHSEYMQKCKEFADSNMTFLGYIPSSSDEYWSVLKYARCACLVSDCETPGIAMIEAAYAGCRPIITKYGGTNEYYGFDAEYLDPCSLKDIKCAVMNGWQRGCLTDSEADFYSRFTWDYCARLTLQAYEYAINKDKFL